MDPFSNIHARNVEKSRIEQYFQNYDTVMSDLYSVVEAIDFDDPANDFLLIRELIYTPIQLQEMNHKTLNMLPWTVFDDKVIKNASVDLSRFYREGHPHTLDLYSHLRELDYDNLPKFKIFLLPFKKSISENLMYFRLLILGDENLNAETTIRIILTPEESLWANYEHYNKAREFEYDILIPISPGKLTMVDICLEHRISLSNISRASMHLERKFHSFYVNFVKEIKKDERSTSITILPFKIKQIYTRAPPIIAVDQLPGSYYPAKNPFRIEAYEVLVASRFLGFADSRILKPEVVQHIIERDVSEREYPISKMLKKKKLLDKIRSDVFFADYFECQKSIEGDEQVLNKK